mgnify:CR=1 FL=1
MKDLIKWLLQNTPDGATYLQVIILGAVLIFALWGLYATIKDTIYILKEGDDDDGEINS